MKDLELFAFTAGSLVIDKGFFNNEEWGKPYIHPCPMYAFRHPKGIVLFDTGISHRGLNNGEEWWGKDTMERVELHLTREDCMPWQLRGVGIDPADVRYVLLSHMHMDHAGEMESFPNATFIVRKSELRFAWWPDTHMRTGTYANADIRNTRHFDYLELPDTLDFDVFGDGRLVLLHTPGHTPGHQSLRVIADNVPGPIVLTADAAYLKDNLFGGKLVSTGLMWNTDCYLDSIRRLRHYADLGYDLWVGHDQAGWEENVGKISH